MFRRLFSLILSVILLWMPLAHSVSAKDNESYQWFIKHAQNHETPSCDKRLANIADKGGYYLGPEALPGDNSKKIYLTFDLGYINDNVIRILDTLKEKGVHAAFFILGHVANKEPEILKRIYSDGHLICNHTFHHTDVSKASKEEFLAELHTLEEAYSCATGNRLSMFFRPPEGKFSMQSLEWALEAGYVTVFWSFAYFDWDNNKQPDPSWALNKMLKHTHKREILLLHPTSNTNADILGDFIDACRKDSFEFGSLNDLILRTH